MFLHALSCNTSENFINQKCGVSDEMCCLSLPVSYQGRRDILQWASFPETSRVFSFSAGTLILIKVEEMFHNMNFTLNFIHSVSCAVFSGLVSHMLLLSMSTWGYECFIQTCHHMLIFGSQKVLLLWLPHISVKCAVLLVIPAGK